MAHSKGSCRARAYIRCARTLDNEREALENTSPTVVVAFANEAFPVPLYDLPDVFLTLRRLAVKRHTLYSAGKSGDIRAAGARAAQLVTRYRWSRYPRRLSD